MNAKEPTTQELIDWLRACATQGFHGRLEICAARLALLNSAVPVVEQLVEASTMLLSYTIACEGLLNAKPAGQIDIARDAIEAGQKFIQENNK